MLKDGFSRVVRANLKVKLDQLCFLLIETLTKLLSATQTLPLFNNETGSRSSLVYLNYGEAYQGPFQTLAKSFACFPG